MTKEKEMLIGNCQRCLLACVSAVVSSRHSRRPPREAQAVCRSGTQTDEVDRTENVS